ncbi:hypothetical protein BMS_1928A [Halobacteriovorax marinus SJ]|uniref:Uncharacterized protein n=2 Tax=Halobacteriovorax marinus TaxID=97084 RepID=E1X2H8_HALMS|nr:hypothetical protein BMS_1928A [Halobacteriovorax marinus SJ]
MKPNDLLNSLSEQVEELFSERICHSRLKSNKTLDDGVISSSDAIMCCLIKESYRKTIRSDYSECLVQHVAIVFIFNYRICDFISSLISALRHSLKFITKIIGLLSLKFL